MTQEEKDLLLKDLFARLPYKVKVQYKNNICSIDTYTEGNKFLLIDEKKNEYPSIKDKLFLGIEEFKQYLFPFSSMTEEQMDKVEEILMGYDPKIIFDFMADGDIIFKKGNISIKAFIELTQYFDKEMLDYRGLIPMGLAVDATGLNIY